MFPAARRLRHRPQLIEIVLPPAWRQADRHRAREKIRLVHPARRSSAICDRYSGVFGLVSYPTRGAQSRHGQSNTVFAFGADTRVCPHRIFATRDGVGDPVFCLPRYLPTPFRLKRVVSNDSCVLDDSQRYWQLHILLWVPPQQGKQHNRKNARGGSDLRCGNPIHAERPFIATVDPRHFGLVTHDPDCS
jgi:hypothetical protein